MTALVVADDQEMVRDGLAAILATEPDLEIVGTAADGAEAVDHRPAGAARRRRDGRADARHGRDRGDPA